MSSNSDKDRYRKLFQEHFGEVKPIWQIDTLLFLIALIGLILNGLLLIVTYRKRSKAIDIILISTIACFDIIWCSTLLINLISNWLFSQVLSSDSQLCRFSAISFNASFLSTIVCTSILALMRYLAIVRKLSLSTRIWSVVSLVSVSTVWILFVQRGFTELLFVMPAGFYCLPQIFGDDWSAKLFEIAILTLMYPSYLLIPTCYILIAIYYRHQFTSITPSYYSTSKPHTGTIHLLLFLFAYSIAIFPDAIHVILSTYYNVKRTSLSDGIVMSLEFTLSAINAIFALLMHDEIHLEFRSLIKFFSNHPTYPYQI